MCLYKSVSFVKRLNFGVLVTCVFFTRVIPFLCVAYYGIWLYLVILVYLANIANSITYTFIV